MLVVIIKTSMIPKGYGAFSVWPFIFMRDPKNAGLLAHEMVHYKEQRGCLTVPWLLCYAFETKFRVACEVRAHRAEIAHGSITLADAAKSLLRYSKKLTMGEALCRLGAP